MIFGNLPVFITDKIRDSSTPVNANPKYGTSRVFSFFLMYSVRSVFESTLLKYPEIKTNNGIKNELNGISPANRPRAFWACASTIMMIAMAESTMNFLLLFLSVIVLLI